MASTTANIVYRAASIVGLGPLGSAALMAGGAAAAGVGGDFAVGLAGSAAASLLCSALRSLKEHRNSDIERSMKEAAIQALAALKDKSQPGQQHYFNAWRDYLIRTPPDKLFTSTGEADPILLQYSDSEIRAYWWSRMEDTLRRWLPAGEAVYSQLHIDNPEPLPEPLRTLLRDHLPEAMRDAHDRVTRKGAPNASWVAFEQHAFRALLETQQQILTALRVPAPPAKIFDIPRPTEHFQDRPELLAQIESALATPGVSVTAITALHGLGGIGKSQLARRYAHLHPDRYQVAAWLDAETEVALMAGLGRLASLLRLPPEQDQRALAQVRHLKG
ncbi:MAG: hypothetical protein FJW39_29825 [Acidobacteria bacterium]|nr:hypothetical protein [Acidobacteriota bacterium]